MTRRRTVHRRTFAALLIAVVSPAVASADAEPRTAIVSIGSDGSLGDGDSGEPSISSDGRIVVFSSIASNLVASDANGVGDVFVHDRGAGTTDRLSVALGGGEADGRSLSPAPSADGSVVAFASIASNLVAADGNATFDVFVVDRPAGTVSRLSVSTAEGEADGRSLEPALSGDGSTVAFTSWATNLVAGDGNEVSDVFVHDRGTGETTRVSVASNGGEASGPSGSPALSSDGRFVAFTSWATNLEAADDNGVADVFVHDRLTGATELVSVSDDGAEGNAASGTSSLSADGSVVAFASEASNLVEGDANRARDVFIHDRATGRTLRASVDGSGGEGFGQSDEPSLSADARFVTFHSFASNLVPVDTNGWPDIFVRDLDAGRTVRVSVDGSGAQANDGPSLRPAISGDGRLVALWSRASNLQAGDVNDNWDVFVRNRGDESCPDGTRWEGSMTGPSSSINRSVSTLASPIVCALAAAGL